MRVVTLLLVLVIAAAAATYWRYRSFDPCDWMVQDLEVQTGLPSLVVETRIAAHFLLEGITNPGADDCLFAWWDIRRDGLPES